MKKSNQYLCALALLSVSISVHAYDISNCQELQDISDPTGYYTLVNSIDCKEIVFKPITEIFLGTLDGQGYTIANLTIDGGSLFNQVGTPEHIYTPVIHDIHFENAKVQGLDDRALLAAIAYYTDVSDITVYNLYVGNENDKTNKFSAGLIASAYGVNISNVHLGGDLITGVKIKVRRFGGGLIAQAAWGTQIRNTSVKYLKTEGHCLGDKTQCGIGGLIGFLPPGDPSFPVNITQSSAHGKLNGRHNNGGLVGLISLGAPLLISHSYTMVEIDNVHYAGGLIGEALGKRSNGALEDVILNNVYATGTIHLEGRKGGRGILGNEDRTSPRVFASESYFDMHTTGKDYAGDSYSVGLSTREMQHPDTFSADKGWDRMIWDVTPGHYPALIKPEN